MPNKRRKNYIWRHVFRSYHWQQVGGAPHLKNWHAGDTWDRIKRKLHWKWKKVHWKIYSKKKAAFRTSTRNVTTCQVNGVWGVCKRQCLHEYDVFQEIGASRVHFHILPANGKTKIANSRQRRVSARARLTQRSRAKRNDFTYVRSRAFLISTKYNSYPRR